MESSADVLDQSVPANQNEPLSAAIADTPQIVRSETWKPFSRANANILTFKVIILA